MRRFSGNILAPTLYCIYVFQLLAIISTEAVRDGFALLFFFVLHSFRPFYCLRKVHAAQGRFSAQQVDKAKKYLLERQEATKNRFCHLPQRSSETCERIISASLSGDWLHQVLGGLPLINTQNMQPEKKPPVQKTPSSGKKAEPTARNSAKSSTGSGKDKFPRIFALVKPAASAPLPPRSKITKKSFQLATAATPASEKPAGNVSSASSKKSIVSISDLRNPWADHKQTKAQSGNQASEKSHSDNTSHLGSSVSLTTAHSGNVNSEKYQTEKAQAEQTQLENPQQGKTLVERLHQEAQTDKLGEEKTQIEATQLERLQKEAPSKTQTAPSGSSIRSKIIQFEKQPPDHPPAFPER